MKYRVYINISGWKLHEVIPKTLEEAMKILEGYIANDVQEFMIVESSKENGDVVIVSTMRSYLRIKEELENKKVKKLVR